MSEVKQDSGPAFPARPSERFSDGSTITAHNGMSLRDYFAAKALPVVASGSHLMGQEFLHSDQFASAAFDAYKLADAMIKARQA